MKLRLPTLHERFKWLLARWPDDGVYRYGVEVTAPASRHTSGYRRQRRRHGYAHWPPRWAHPWRL
jgi:hypothetical protein